MLKVFISYCHQDEYLINEFKKHIHPLCADKKISIWQDRMIVSGEDWKSKIFKNLNDSDIICLFISANFLASNSCIEELNISKELKEKKDVIVIPIILADCAWKDNSFIANTLVLPEDGKAIETHKSQNTAWHSIYEDLKKIIDKKIKYNKANIKNEFLQFINSADILTKAHSNKNNLLLDDIFIHPPLEKFDEFRERQDNVSSQIVIEELFLYSKVLIAGESQSGKTTLCKYFYKNLFNRKYFPIYLCDKNNNFKGLINKKIEKAFYEQYEGVVFEEIEVNRIIPIIDDFHYANLKDKIINDLDIYTNLVIIVDDIFSLNIKNEKQLRGFSHFKIKELLPSHRNNLIEKWIHLSDNENYNDNVRYHYLDKTTELINVSLGKVIGGGIMPAYPFYILSVISSHETFGTQLDQEITSQGYCYQALIYLSLSKVGVKNDEIDTYKNFLTELAFFIYSKKLVIIDQLDFAEFMRTYLNSFNLPIDQNILLQKLNETQIFIKDSTGNYLFKYLYLYYFFVAKYLSDNNSSNDLHLDYIVSNLHKDENSYIAIFISHHSKNDSILDRIIAKSDELFSKNIPALLTNDETKFFDEKLDNIIKEVLPLSTDCPEKERATRLKYADKVEESIINDESKEDDENNLAKELRRSVKTVEVMGLAIKNRAGSLRKDKIELIFEHAMNVHLRSLNGFFDIIKSHEDIIVDYLSSRNIQKIQEHNKKQVLKNKPIKTLSNDDLKKLSKIIYWNLNFNIVYSILNKIIHSLGSNKLIEIVDNVCDKENSPASFLIKHGIYMWYCKSLNLDKIEKKFLEPNFSETAKKIVRYMVINHCKMHRLDYKEYQKIENKLGISKANLRVNSSNNITYEK